MTKRIQRFHRLHRRLLTGFGVGLTLAGTLLAQPTPAVAWDPSTTHQALLESAVLRSAIHLRWMDASALERGLFSPLRLDPDRLSVEQRRLLQLAIRGAHADSGALPLGGPGACPSASAPTETQLFCVSEDLWEHSAIGWMRLGVLAEVTPSARHIHHFLDREQLDADAWADRELPQVVLRTRQARTNGEPSAGVATGTNFDGRAPTALTWLDDPDDLLAPPHTYEHLRRASLAPTQAERDHELALALIGVGALLHVLQDISVPAHARGDASAFFAPLSPAAGDRGLPLQEFVRVEYGRADLPGVARAVAAEPPRGIPLAQTLVGHLLGEGQYEGLASLAGRRYFSESSVPAPQYLESTLSPSEAAAALLGADHLLDPVEVDSATLSPWPAERGYLLSPTGRALAAFDTDLDGRIRPYLDEACYRDAAANLLPAAAAVTTSVLDLLWPAWPTSRRDGDALIVTPPAGAGPGAWTSGSVTVLIEASNGDRRVVGEHPVAIGGDTRIELGVATLAEGERVVLLLEATRPGGPPIILEQALASMIEGQVTPAPEPEPEPTDEPATDEAAPTPDQPTSIEVQPFGR